MLTEQEIRQIQIDLDNYKNLSSKQLQSLYDKIDECCNEAIEIDKQRLLNEK